jgi:hypothetical protein
MSAARARVIEQRRLANAGFAKQHERPAAAVARSIEKLADANALAVSAVQHRPRSYSPSVPLIRRNRRCERSAERPSCEPTYLHRRPMT